MPDAAVAERKPEHSRGGIVHSVDFGAPLVDDPEIAARIAVAHALSDLYAVGSVPFAADLLLEVARSDSSRAHRGEVLVRAMTAALLDSGVQSIGGHSTAGCEYRIGCSVIGGADGPLRRIDAARPGDVVVLSKPLGIGLAATSVKMGLVPFDRTAEWIIVALRSNAESSMLLRTAGSEAATDVTGFGLIGALVNVAEASGVGINVRASVVPVLSAGAAAAAAGAVPAIVDDTLAALGDVAWADDVEWEERVVFASPETSGGLLGFVRPENTAVLGTDFVGIGSVELGSGVRVARD